MKRSVSYTDGLGQSHNTPEAATVSDLSQLLLVDKHPRGVALEFAGLIFKRRADIERIFREHDEATTNAE